MGKKGKDIDLKLESIQSDFEIGDYRSALKKIKKSLNRLQSTIAKQKHDAETINNFFFLKVSEGECYFHLNELDKALGSFQYILDRVEVNEKSLSLISAINQKIGKIYLAKNDLQNSKIYYKSAIEGFLKIKRHDEALNIGQLYLNILQLTREADLNLVKKLEKASKKIKDKEKQERYNTIIKFNKITMKGGKKLFNDLSSFLEKSKNKKLSNSLVLNGFNYIELEREQKAMLLEQCVINSEDANGFNDVFKVILSHEFTWRDLGKWQNSTKDTLRNEIDRLVGSNVLVERAFGKNLKRTLEEQQSTELSWDEIEMTLKIMNQFDKEDPLYKNLLPMITDQISMKTKIKDQVMDYAMDIFRKKKDWCALLSILSVTLSSGKQTYQKGVDLLPRCKNKDIRKKFLEEVKNLKDALNLSDAEVSSLEKRFLP